MEIFEINSEKLKSVFEKKGCKSGFHIASLPISQSCFFKEVRCSILASSQRKLRGYIEFLKFHVTIKKIKKIQIRLKFKSRD